jgi:nicotinamide-nucleotide amidase
MNSDPDDRLESRLGEALRAADASLAIAESATGGLVASRITDVHGASDYFERGFVTYANRAKQAALGVSREALDAHGAVSSPVAAEMAAGARDVAGTDWGLATTAIAGPTGGTEEKPVGTAFVGVAHAAPWGSGDSAVTVDHHVLDGDRESVKAAIADRALAALLEAVERTADG